MAGKVPKIAIGITLASACLLAGAFALARHDVLTSLKSPDEPNVTVTLGYIAPSRTHGFYFAFKIQGHSQLSWAFWRALPFRDIDVEM
jgi:hypothetical protein